MKKETFAKKTGVAGVAMLSAASAGVAVRNGAPEDTQRGAVVVEAPYFCNVKALNAGEKKSTRS